MCLFPRLLGLPPLPLLLASKVGLPSSDPQVCLRHCKYGSIELVNKDSNRDKIRSLILFALHLPPLSITETVNSLPAL